MQGIDNYHECSIGVRVSCGAEKLNKKSLIFLLLNVVLLDTLSVEYDVHKRLWCRKWYVFGCLRNMNYDHWYHIV